MNLSNIAVYIHHITPIVAIIFSFFTWRDRKLCFTVETVLCTLAWFLTVNTFASLYLSRYIYLYAWLIAALFPLFILKFDFNVFSALTVSLMVAFIAADFWEIPIFVYGYLGDPRYTQYIQHGYNIHHLYVGAITYVLYRLTRFKIGKAQLLILLGGVFASFMLTYFAPQALTLRLVGIIPFSIVMYLGIRKNGFYSLVGVKS